MKILELQQAGKKKTANQPVIYDISEVGYQQFDMMDSFDIFANPHGLEEVTDFDRNNLKQLYSVSTLTIILTLFLGQEIPQLRRPVCSW